MDKKKCILLFISLSFFMITGNQLQAYSIIKNVADFDNQDFTHIDFESTSSQGTAAAINTFLDGKATYSGPNPRFTSSITSSGGGYDGGAVSGVGHICGSGYTLSLTFTQAVDAFGFFVGGLHFLTSTNFSATFADNTTVSVPVTHLSLSQNGSSSTGAIGGFIGVDSDGGKLIKSFSFYHTSDTHSLDDIYFGNANYSGTTGVQPFSESGMSGGTHMTLPVYGLPVPEPATTILTGIFLCAFLIKNKK